ncbi:MAG: hypothetical protein V1888_00415 [archaeon]
MWSLFGHKKRIDNLKDDVKDSFDHVKKDFNKVGEWIRHLDDKHSLYNNELLDIKDQLLAIQCDIVEIKNFISFFGPQLSKDVSKQEQTDVNKQTMYRAVQTPAQTDVQTDILDNLTVMERGIVWALLNSKMKLSYEDLAALLGKNRSTIRGQINTIKQKNSRLIMEYREIGGKKRLYIPEEIQSKIIKSVKINVKSDKNRINSKK